MGNQFFPFGFGGIDVEEKVPNVTQLFTGSLVNNIFTFRRNIAIRPKRREEERGRLAVKLTVGRWTCPELYSKEFWRSDGELHGWPGSSSLHLEGNDLYVTKDYSYRVLTSRGLPAQLLKQATRTMLRLGSGSLQA